MTTPVTTAPRLPYSSAGNGRTPSAGPTEAVELTLEPLSLSDFLDEHWGERPLVQERAEEARFDRVLSLTDVERLVSETAIRTPGFRLVKDGGQLPLGDYTEDIPWRPGGFTGTVVVDRVAEEFRGGATIVLQGLHIHWHPTAVYCRMLEHAFGCPVQANAYFTPPSAQGFDVHHDVHDVFVLQVAGAKRWEWFDPVHQLPLRNQRWSSHGGDAGPPAASAELQPGDTLYLPRGWPHRAATSSEPSLHLTVGLHPPTRMDLLRVALEGCAEEDVEFRRTMVRGERFPTALIERLGERLASDDVSRRLRRRFVASRRPIRENRLAELDRAERISATDRVERRPTVIAELERDDRQARLLFEGKEVSFPAAAGYALAAAFDARSSFIPAELPGCLDEAGRIVLVRRLLREGFLALVPDAPTAPVPRGSRNKS